MLAIRYGVARVQHVVLERAGGVYRRRLEITALSAGPRGFGVVDVNTYAAEFQCALCTSDDAAAVVKPRWAMASSSHSESNDSGFSKLHRQIELDIGFSAAIAKFHRPEELSLFP